MTFVAYMIGIGIVTEALRSVTLRKRHGMTLKEYYQRLARGEKVPRL